ncbi:MAG: DUF1653 domain-containing protein [Candidatus Woesearchaeota archaeon]
MEELKVGGIYQHYKGNFYVLISLAHHSETLEPLVVYMGLYESEEFGKNPFWVRPLSLFTDQVQWEGQKVLRFKFIK